MEEVEKRKISQQLHKESQELYDKCQNALCFIVIGGIFLSIGIIFIFLAFKRENNVMTSIDVNSLAFYIMVAGLGVGSISLINGVVRYIINFVKRREVLNKINGLK